MCFGNQHTFTWGSSTATDAMPLSLRCECGAMSREDIAALRQLQAENVLLQRQLKIATDFLEGLSQQHGTGERYPGEAATFAEDALIRISVADDD